MVSVNKSFQHEVLMVLWFIFAMIPPVTTGSAIVCGIIGGYHAVCLLYYTFKDNISIKVMKKKE